MTTPRFDRSRPYGEVIPSGGYHQDGHFFNVHGEYLRSDDVTEAPKPPAEKPKAPEPSEIDLAAWAKGEKKYPHYSVVKAANAAFPDDVGTSRASVIAVLIANGVVSEEEAVL